MRHAKMSLTLNEPISSDVCSNLHTTTPKHTPNTYRKLKVLYSKTTNSQTKIHVELED